MKQHVTVGIDIGTATTRVVVCEHASEREGVARVLGTGVVATKGMRHGYVVNRDEVAQSVTRAVRDAEKESGVRIRSANIAIGGVGIATEYATGMSVVTRADGVVSKLDIEKAIAEAEGTLDLKNRTILHAFPLVFKVDGKELPARPEGIRGIKLEVKVLFITAFEQHLDDLLWTINEAGIKVTNFTATPIAAEHVLLDDLQRNFGCTLIDIGAETVSVAVFENNMLTSTHVFGIGSLDITKDIALGLRITPEEAEGIKTGVISFQHVPKKRLDEIIDARLSDIFELVDKYFRKIGRSGLLPAGAIITGGASVMPAIEQVAKAILKIPVRIGHVEIPSTKSSIKDNRFLVAYGVATAETAHTGTKQSKGSLDTDGFLDTIKHFFKQLMP